MAPVLIDPATRWDGHGLRDRLLVGYARVVPPHPSKIRLFRWLAGHCFPTGLRVTNPQGVHLVVDPLDYIGHEICFSGAYEPASVALARRLLEGGGTFLDVGANFGLYTCPMAAVPGVRCVAVDASALAFVKLQRNLGLNATGPVESVNVALGTERSLVRLETPVAGNLGTTRVAAGETEPGTRSDWVAAMPLDELLRSLSVERIRLMKIDVEGYEFAVFGGMDFSAGYRPDNIIMEYSDRILPEAAHLQDCFALLSGHGYRPFSVTGAPFTGTLPLPEENLWWRHRDLA